MSAAWALQCQKCGKFLDWDDVLRVHEEVPVHYDALTKHPCGPVERVELKSEHGADAD